CTSGVGRRSKATVPDVLEPDLRGEVERPRVLGLDSGHREQKERGPQEEQQGRSGQQRSHLSPPLFRDCGGFNWRAPASPNQPSRGAGRGNSVASRLRIVTILSSPLIEIARS